MSDLDEIDAAMQAEHDEHVAAQQRKCCCLCKDPEFKQIVERILDRYNERPHQWHGWPALLRVLKGLYPAVRVGHRGLADAIHKHFEEKLVALYATD